MWLWVSSSTYSWIKSIVFNIIDISKNLEFIVLMYKQGGIEHLNYYCNGENIIKV